MPTSPPFRRPSPAARAFAARRARSRGPPRPDLIFRSADPRIPRLSPHSSPSLRKGTSPRRSSPSRAPRQCSTAGPSPSPFAPASTLVRDPPIRAISRSIDGIVLDRFRSPRAFATLRSPPSVAAETRAIGVIYGIFQKARFLRYPRQQSAHRNVPRFSPTALNAKDAGGSNLLDAGNYAGLANVSDFDINVRAHLILYPGALHASESAIRENRGEFATGLENAGFFPLSTGPPEPPLCFHKKKSEKRVLFFPLARRVSLTSFPP